MKRAVIALSHEGAAVCRRLVSFLSADEDSCRGFVLPDQTHGPEGIEAQAASALIGQALKDAQTLVLVGPIGRAVLALSGHLKKKAPEADLIVVDDSGTYVIPLFEGREEGRQKLSILLAGFLQTEVIQTDHDGAGGTFSLDIFAEKNRLFVTNRLRAQKIYGDVLAGRMIHICCPASQVPAGAGFSVKEILASKVMWTDSPLSAQIVVSSQLLNPDQDALLLVPRKVVWIGMAFKKGCQSEEFRDALSSFIEDYSFHEKAVAGIAVMTSAMEDEAFADFCQAYHLPVRTYSPAQLMALEGTAESSGLVHMHGGAVNLCDRAALMAAAQDARAYNEENKGQEAGAFALSIIARQRCGSVSLAAAYVNRRLRL